MKASRQIGVVALLVTVFGCAESTMIRSYPPSSKLFVNDHFEGLTPIAFTASRSEFGSGNFKVRLEHDGYATVEDTLKKRVCGGRIVGAVFTLGIVFLFKGPTCFASPQDFALPASTSQGTAPDNGTSAPANRQPTVEERLQRIQRMRDQGVITNEEYEQYRKEILKGL